jgi:pantoate kinase
VAGFETRVGAQVAYVVYEECGEGGVVVEFGAAGPAGAGLGVVGASVSGSALCIRDMCSRRTGS